MTPDRPTQKALLRSALWYAQNGYYVIRLHTPLFDAVDSKGNPTRCSCEDFWRFKGTRRRPADPNYICPTPGKHPRVGYDWEEKATCDEAQIRRWWTQYPNSNVGIAAGKSGLVVIDKDTYHLAEESGIDLVFADKDTVTSLTGGGGEHLLYLHPEDGPAIHNDDRDLPDWVNVRAHGGMIVAPPSLHPSGRQYQWEVDYGPHEREPSPLPEVLRKLLQGEVRRSNGNSKQFKLPLEGKITPGKRHSALVSAAASDRARGFAPPVIEAKLKAMVEHHVEQPEGARKVTDAEIRDIVDWAATHEPGQLTGANGNGHENFPPGGELPSIVVSHRHVRDISHEAYHELVKANDPPFVFQYAGVLARVTAGGGRPTIELLDGNMLRHRLNRIANFVSQRVTENGPVFTPVNAPARLVNDLLAYPEWPRLPTLDGVVTAPVVSALGDVRQRPGYDADTRLLYMSVDGLEVGNTKPTADRLTWAREMIEELICDFPFRGEASKANAASLLLLPFARPLIDGNTPLHTITAPKEGTGKGLLASALTLPFNPDGPLIMVAGNDEDEWRKRITSVLASGGSHVLIDNIKDPLVSGSLAAVLTAKIWTDRVLGSNTVIHVQNRQVWLATGNNIVIDSELARRCCWIQLDSNEERPWLREAFRHPNLLEWVTKERDNLVTAALIIVRNWFVKGCPAGSQVIGSFEAWSRVMGGILDAAGIVGFMGNSNDLYERADPSTALWAEFIRAWWGKFKDNPTGTGDLFPLADSEPAKDERGDGILDDLLGGGSIRSRKIRLGKLLGQRVNQVVAGYKIEDAGTHNRARQYRLRPLGTEGGPML